MPTNITPELGATSEGHCRSDSCHRALSRTVRYCPFCGTAQAADAAEQKSEPGLISTSAGVPPQRQSEVIQSISVDVLAERQIDDTVKPIIHEKRVDTPPAPQQLDTKSLQADQVIEKPRKRLSAGRLALFAGLFIIAVLLVLRATLYTGAMAPVIVRAVARPDQWTVIDISAFGAGTQVIVGGDGPFRVRTTSDAPILVVGGSTALGQIHSAGFEVKSANGNLVHITVQGSRDFGSRTSENKRGLNSTVAYANYVASAPNLPTTTASTSPSFACNRAKVRVEFLICSDQNLANVDNEMANLYRIAMLHVSTPATLRIEQRSWLRTVRNACKDVVCLQNAYRERMRQLSAHSS